HVHQARQPSKDQRGLGVWGLFVRRDYSKPRGAGHGLGRHQGLGAHSSFLGGGPSSASSRSRSRARSALELTSETAGCAMERAGGRARLSSASPSRVKRMKAMAGRFEASRMANWMPSRFHPWDTHALMVCSRVASSTVESSTTLY